jgi:hypothetical protein
MFEVAGLWANKKVPALPVGQRGHLFIKLSLLTETLLEFRDAAASIKNLLLTGVERMAFAAHICVDLTTL